MIPPFSDLNQKKAAPLPTQWMEHWRLNGWTCRRGGRSRNLAAAALRQQARDPRVPSGILKKMGPYCAEWDPKRVRAQRGFEFLDLKAPGAAEVTAAVFGFLRVTISDPVVSHVDGCSHVRFVARYGPQSEAVGSPLCAKTGSRS
jgi:hypothetical protein